MANATQRVAKGVVDFDQPLYTVPLATLASATNFYPNAGIGIKSTGYGAKFDDTAVMQLAGVVANDHGQRFPAGTQGDAALDCRVHKPRYLELAVSGVAITDKGRKVYVVDDQTGTLDAGATTYGNVWGTVRDYLASGIALVELEYAPNFAAPGIQLLSVSGAVNIREGICIINKAGVAVLTIADPTTGVHDGLTMTFISSTAQAHTLSNGAGSGFNAGGAGTDVGTWGGAIGDGMRITAYGGKWLVNYLRNVTLG